MFAYQNPETGAVNTESGWRDLMDMLEREDGTSMSFEEEVASGRLVQIEIEISGLRIGREQGETIEWQAFGEDEDGNGYVLIELVPIGEKAQWTEESVDSIVEEDS